MTCSGFLCCRSLPQHDRHSTVLDVRVPFLDAAPLKPDVHEAYLQPRTASKDASVFEHCVSAIDKGLTSGAHDCR